MDPIELAFGKLIGVFLDTTTLIGCGGCYFLIRFLNRLPFLSQRAWWRRILPLLPDVFGVGICASGAVPAVASMPFAIRILAGLWIGYVSSRFHKILGQTVLGDDDKIAEIAVKVRTASQDIISRSFPPGSGPRSIAPKSEQIETETIVESTTTKKEGE